MGSETVRTTERLRELSLYLQRRYIREAALFLGRAPAYTMLYDRLHAELRRRDYPASVVRMHWTAGTYEFHEDADGLTG